MRQVTVATFTKLNHSWNADPNSPAPKIADHGSDLELSFQLNAFQFKWFRELERGTLHFENVSRYRLGPTNDEGWHRGQCRFSSLAPAWGEFYSINSDAALLNAPVDWQHKIVAAPGTMHLLFYMRDSTFECVCNSWEVSRLTGNALLRLGAD